MRSAITFSLVALSGSALAVPFFGHIGQQVDKQVKNVHVVVETVVHTVYITEGSIPAPTPAPVPEQYYEAPPMPTIIYEAPEPEPEPTTSAVYVAPSPPAPQPTPSQPEPAPPAPNNSGYQAVVDEWRAKLGLKPLTNSKKLEDNAKDTVAASKGQMIHKLNTGSFGQVLAPGDEDNFEHVFVGGWLCEIPTLAGLAGVCETQSEGWTYQGQTGHAELLTSPDYTEIGCALGFGIWCCDLA